MNDLTALRHRFRAGSLARRLSVLVVLYASYLLYVGVNFVSVPSGLEDPIYRLTGAPRTDQLVGTSLVFGIVGAVLILFHIVRRGGMEALRPGTAAALLVLLALNAAAGSLSAVYADIDPRFWLPLYGWVAAVLAVQAIMVLAVSRFRRPWLTMVLLVVLGALDIYALELALMDAIRAWPVPLRAMTIVLVALGAAVLFAAISTRTVAVWRVVGVLVLTALAPLAALAVSSLPASAPERLQAFADIELATKPNIHIVSIDSLSPPAVVRRYLRLEHVAYEEVLVDGGASRLRNAFASEVPTKPSLNSVMRLAQADFPVSYGYFAGRLDGPVTALLHANGYHVATGFPNLYVGSKGPYVDTFAPAPSRSVRNSTLCELATGSPLRFFGFCRVGELLSAPTPEGEWTARVIGRIGNAGSAAQPVFTFHHILDPIGHTSSEFRTADETALKSYAQEYARRSVVAAGIMKRLMRKVSDDGRPSILVVMGDHGTYVSRTAPREENESFVVQDRHGIALAVLVNESGCTIEHLRHYSAAYATPERLLAGVFRCLAREPEKLDRLVNFAESERFERFTYE